MPKTLRPSAWVGSRSQLAKIANSDCSLKVDASKIQLSAVVRDLGRHLNTELSVAKVAAICYYQLRRLRQIRRRVGQEVTTCLVLAMVISRLDYCNAALAATVAPLQRVQNSAARLIFKLSSREHVTPCLLQLHWLPVCWHIQFKLCCIMHSVFYLRDVSGVSDQHRRAGRTRSGLRSTSSTDYTLPRLRTKFAERAFSYVGPSAWNGLPEDLRAVADPAEFRKELKTYYFTAAHNVY